MDKLLDYDEAIWYIECIIRDQYCDRYYSIEIPGLPKLDYCIIYRLRQLGLDGVIDTYMVSLIDNHYRIVNGEDKIISKDIYNIMNCEECTGTRMIKCESGSITSPHKYDRLWDYLIYLVNEETGSNINQEIPNYKHMEEI